MKFEFEVIYEMFLILNCEFEIAFVSAMIIAHLIYVRICKKIINSLNSSSDPDPRYTATAHRRDKVKGPLDGQGQEKKLRESRVERDRDWANDEHTAGQRNDRRQKRVQLNSRPVNRHEPRGGGL